MTNVFVTSKNHKSSLRQYISQNMVSKFEKSLQCRTIKISCYITNLRLINSKRSLYSENQAS